MISGTVEPSHKKRYILIVIISLSVLFLGFRLITSLPSEEMRPLLKIESALDLPKPTYRKVIDSGYDSGNRNGPKNGPETYNRNIWLQYSDGAAIELANTKLVQMGWKKLPPSEGSDPEFEATYVNEDKSACVETTLAHSFLVDSVRIGASTDTLCKRV